MSQRRIPENAGFCNPQARPKGPRGLNLCRECGSECTGKARTFCSSECVHAWKCRTNPSYQRAQVLKRDRGVCQDCGVDCLAKQAEYQTLKYQRAGSVRSTEDPHVWVNATSEQIKEAGAAMVSFRETFKVPPHRHTLWDMDHIKPVTEGGGECGLDNLRTLCIPCHKRHTKELAARRAAARKKADAEAADPLHRFKDGD